MNLRLSQQVKKGNEMMKTKRKTIIIFILILVFCILVAGCLGFMEGCKYIEKHVFQEPQISPSGNYICEQMYGYSLARYVRIAILPYNDKETIGGYILEDRFYIRHETIIEWGQDDRLWVLQR